MTPGKLILLFGNSDADALAWRARVNAAGGSVSQATYSAVVKFSRSCKAAGIWDKLNRVNLFCGDQLTAALVPLKVGAGNATDTNVNFVSGDYTESAGLTGNGSSKYLATGVSDAVFGLTAHVAAYLRVVPSQVLAGIIGSNATLLQRTTDPRTATRIGSASQEASINGAATPAFLVGSRTSSTAIALYRNGTVLATNSNAVTDGTGGAINVFARGSGFNDRFENGTLGAYSVGPSLSNPEVAAYNTIMEAFQDALNRGVQ